MKKEMKNKHKNNRKRCIIGLLEVKNIKEIIRQHLPSQNKNKNKNKNRILLKKADKNRIKYVNM